MAMAEGPSGWGMKRQEVLAGGCVCAWRDERAAWVGVVPV